MRDRLADGVRALSSEAAPTSQPGPPWIGASFEELPADEARALNLRSGEGARVATVTPESPAARAGLQEGDVVLALDGARVRGARSARAGVEASYPGAKLKLAIARGRTGSRTLAMRVGAAPDPAAQPVPGPASAPEQELALSSFAPAEDPVAPEPAALLPAARPAVAETAAPDPAPEELESFTDVHVATAELTAAVPDLDFGSYHALVIGVNGYQQLERLDTAVNDAKAVAALLEDEYGFSTRLLLEATHDDVIGALVEYRRELSPTDNLLIYYAGHGWNDERADQAYWLPLDAEPDNPIRWISNDDITRMIRAMEARHVMIVADSCYSGTLLRDAKLRDRDWGYVARLIERRSRTALTSGGTEPVWDEGEEGHSVFAGIFLRILRENDGVLDGTTLFNAVRRPVMLAADQTPKYGEIRSARHEDGDFLFVRKREAQATPEPAQ